MSWWMTLDLGLVGRGVTVRSWPGERETSLQLPRWLHQLPHIFQISPDISWDPFIPFLISAKKSHPELASGWCCCWAWKWRALGETENPIFRGVFVALYGMKTLDSAVSLVRGKYLNLFFDAFSESSCLQAASWCLVPLSAPQGICISTFFLPSSVPYETNNCGEELTFPYPQVLLAGLIVL